MRCNLEDVAQTCYLTRSQHADTRPTSHSTDPTTPGMWHDNWYDWAGVSILGRARIAQSPVCWARCPAPPVEGIFRSEITWVNTPFPYTLSDGSIYRGLVCAHKHSIARTQKIQTSMPKTGECRQQKNTPSMLHPRRQNVTTSMIGLKRNRSHTQQLSTQNGEPQRCSWERRKRRKPRVFRFGGYQDGCRCIPAIFQRKRLHFQWL